MQLGICWGFGPLNTLWVKDYISQTAADTVKV